MSPGNYASLATTAWRLGPSNVASVMLYRLRCRVWAVPERVRYSPRGDFFLHALRANVPLPNAVAAVRYFGWKEAAQPPDWFFNPFTRRCYAHAGRPWHRVPDFDRDMGDIKCIWELSRWDWMLPFAQQHRRTGEASHLESLNAWLGDWVAKNPPYLGPNWKCGQEASIRVMHLAMTAVILDQVREATDALLDLIRLHLQRIEPTIAYALAQDNNHGTSEAAAHFIGGSWLAARGDAKGQRWAERGRDLLEERVARLFERDGSFSQYSVNYHRLALDTLAIAEIWRRKLGLAAFSERLRERAFSAARWLHAMVDPSSGDAPNLGANDGARLMPLTDADYRDYRHSVHLAMALFAGLRAYEGDGAWNLPLQWLRIEVPAAAVVDPASRQFDDGGYAVLRRGAAMAVMRYARFRFRPAHADALHVDLWKDGSNLLRDGGTYSYADSQWLPYFAGTASHNTVQFDERDQMPRLGRFLFGDWLRTESVEPLAEERGMTVFSASYQDREGVRHQRRISLANGELSVMDDIGGFAQRAVLRWRLAPGGWRVDGRSVTNGDHVLSIEASIPIERFELTTGWESRYYMQRTELPVLEVEVRNPGVLFSTYRWGR